MILTDKELLRKAIREKVFVSGDNTYISSATEEPDRWMFDFRKILLQPHILHAYTELFFERYKHHYPFQVGGLEVAAIPLVTAIVTKSHLLGMPVNGFFVRKSRKKSGLLNMIEGEVNNEPIILVDDIINSGSSFLRQIKVIDALNTEEDLGREIKAVFSILRFSPLERYTDFHERNIMIDSLFTLDEFANLTSQVTLPPPKPKAPNHFTTAWTWRSDNPSLDIVRPKAGVLLNKNYLYTITDHGVVICLDIQTGHEVWKHTIPFNLTKRKQFSKPCIVGDTLVYGAYDGTVYGINAVTGERRWVCFEADWVEGSPCTDKSGQVYLPMEFGFFKKHNALASLSSVDGSVRWSTPIPDGTLQSPAHSDRHSLILTGTSTGTLYALRTKDGKIIWKTNPASLPIQIVAAPCICEETSTVIVTGLARNETEQSGIFAFNIRDGSLRWQNTELQYGSYGTPVVFNNLVLVTGLDKSLRALDLVSGKTIWKTDFKSRVFSTPACGTIRETAYIYLGTNDSVLYEINPATGDVEGASMFTERITNQVVLDEENHAIYVPTYANEIYALKPKSI